MVRVAPLALAAAVALAAGCKGAESPVEKKVDLDADPLALLPGSAVAVADVDARSMFSDGSVGAQVAALADRLVPVGETAGFQARRDVDRVVLGVYATSGADAAAVVSGRFDEAKIDAAATTPAGAPIAHGTYAGRTTYTAGAVTWAVLSSKTVLAGTGDGLRRTLERLQAGAPERAIPAWMAETLATPGAQLALAADFTAQPVTSAALGSMSLPWVSGLRTVKAVGNFGPPGMNLAATLTYGDAPQAASAAEGVRVADGWLKVLGPLIGGVSLQNLDVKTEGAEMKCKASLDERTLGNLLALAPRLLATAQ